MKFVLWTTVSLTLIWRRGLGSRLWWCWSKYWPLYSVDLQIFEYWPLYGVDLHFFSSLHARPGNPWGDKSGLFFCVIGVSSFLILYTINHGNNHNHKLKGGGSLQVFFLCHGIFHLPRLYHSIWMCIHEFNRRNTSLNLLSRIWGLHHQPDDQHKEPMIDTKIIYRVSQKMY